MKNLKTLLMVAAIAGLVTAQALAQRGEDLFGPVRTIVLSGPTIIAASATPMQTNGPIDTHGFVGVATLDIATCTNAGGAMTLQFYTSPDQTNMTTLANYALGVSSSLSYTNLMYGSNTLIATQTTIAPGTITTPTSATAGWATTYIVPALFTNTGAITVTAKADYQVAYNVADAARYLYAVWTPTGSLTNNYVSVIFKGYRQY